MKDVEGQIKLFEDNLGYTGLAEATESKLFKLTDINHLFIREKLPVENVCL